MDKSRQQFEEWFTPQKEEMKNNGLGMISITRMYQRQLSAWQASRENLEIELPDSKYGSEVYKSMIELFRNILISNGVKVKNE